MTFGTVLGGNCMHFMPKFRGKFYAEFRLL